MTKKLMLAALALGLLVVAPPAVAEDEDGGFTVHGMFRDRYDNMNNYFDFEDTDDDDPGTIDRTSFWAYRALVGISGQLAENVWLKIDVQNVGSHGNRSPVGSAASFVGAPFQNLDGDGNSAGFNTGDTSIYRAYVKMKEIGGSNFSLTLGRNEHVIGKGRILGNESFYNGQTFDGVRGWLDFEKWDLSGFYYTVTERNDFASLTGGSFGSEDHMLYGLEAKFDVVWDSKVEAYIVRSSDQGGTAGPELDTIGAVWHRWSEEGGWHWNGQIAFQTGDTDSGDSFGGTFFELAGGYTWAGDISHSIFGGYVMQSGDDDATESDVDAWQPLAPDTHGRFGYADFFGGGFGAGGPIAPGITATHVGYAISGSDMKHQGWVKFWNFMPSEDSVNTGAGSVDIEDAGTEIDFGYSYKYADNVSWFITYAMLSPDDGLTGGGPDDDVTRLYGGVWVEFGGHKKK